MAPAYLGVHAVIAKSFARIHRRNLIAHGILPLQFDNEADLIRAVRGQVWALPGLRATLEQHAPTIEARIVSDGANPIRLRLPTVGREVETLLAGGLLAYL